MGLVQQTLKADFVEILTSFQANKDITSEQAIEQFCEKWSIAIDTYVKSGVVAVTVATTGTAASQTGTGVGTIN